ncbi:MAG: NAD(P)/FAD-dependent oxidoreductase [Frankiaceae bacterium]
MIPDTSLRTDASRHWDAVVVGARCAGAATAMLLARHGMDVLVLDRARCGSDTVSTHGLVRGGTLQLRRWGLLDRIAAAGTPGIRRTVFHYCEGARVEDVAVSVKPVAGVDRFYASRRTVVDSVLVDAARDAGATLRFGTTVTDVLRGAGGAVNGVVARPYHGDPVKIAADVVVGADGLRSVVASRVGAPVERIGTGTSGFLYGYWTGIPVEGYEWYYRPGVMAGMFPTNDGRTCVLVGAPAARVRQVGSAGFDRLLAEADPSAMARARAGVPDGRLRAFTAPPGYHRRAFGDGWALVGDAGHWKDPAGMHGMTDAFRDAEFLARALVATPSRGRRRDLALADYQATRDHLSVRMADVVDEIAAFDWTLARLRRLLLEMSSAMADEVEALTALDTRAPGEPVRGRRRLAPAVT